MTILEQYKRWRDKRRKAGLCMDCGKPTYGNYYCLIHRARKNARQSRYRIRNREILRQKSIIKRKQWEENNQCIRCGTPLIEDEKGYCVACLSGRSEPQIKGVFYETIN